MFVRNDKQPPRTAERWRCPACASDIRHQQITPQVGEVYRCHICRLELVFNAENGKLTVAPLP
jgi:predicted SprT family Zn-dependent metalloprotease